VVEHYIDIVGVTGSNPVPPTIPNSLLRFAALSRLLDVMYKTDPGVLRQQYSFDAASQRTRLVDPANKVTTYVYDLDGMTSGFLDTAGRVTTFVMDSAGRVTTTQYASGMVRAVAFDLLSRQTVISNKTSGGAVILGLTYTYDKVGNPLVVLDANASTTTYSYDTKYRVTGSNTSGTGAGNFTYTYDAVDNRTFASENGLTNFTFNAFGQIVTSLVGGVVSTYTFDVNGNMTLVNEGGTLTTMTYDKENRMTTSVTGTARTTYTYDGDGLKRSENSGAGVTTLVWDGSEYVGEVVGGVLSKRYQSLGMVIQGYEVGANRKDYGDEVLKVFEV
jgi:YD repeat-containing protein